MGARHPWTRSLLPSTPPARSGRPGAATESGSKRRRADPRCLARSVPPRQRPAWPQPFALGSIVDVHGADQDVVVEAIREGPRPSLRVGCVPCRGCGSVGVDHKRSSRSGGLLALGTWEPTTRRSNEIPSLWGPQGPWRRRRARPPGFRRAQLRTRRLGSASGKTPKRLA